jgi:hypothetical protein
MFIFVYNKKVKTYKKSYSLDIRIMTKGQNVQKVKTYKKSKRTKSQNVQKVKTYKKSYSFEIRKMTKSQNLQKVSFLGQRYLLLK